MKAPAPQTIYLKDYQPPTHWVDHVHLYFNIQDEVTEVRAETSFRPNPDHPSDTLTLHGDFFKLKSIAVNGKTLNSDQYTTREGELTFTPPAGENFKLQVVTHIEPHKNTALEGLYQSGKILCTQNEAEGFRRITYFLDRPDVMATYTTVIEADTKRYPVLLSNGNCTRKEQLAGGRHRLTWEDPFKKPSYLFALVAGQLGKIEGEYITASGRKVQLQIFVDPGNESKAGFALEALKRAMKWDEERWGLEYDLDIYMIVAVGSFNMGAMENKGLNIFNAKYILADPSTTTDKEYIDIESIIGHEYFHNWSGNRVTCRDWFQLSLKEGLTVFRDQEFTSDLHSRAVTRIENVARLWAGQYPEDAGPMAHPVRPSSYMEINNFYTATVYQKGAEVIRMMHTLLGEEGFAKGLKKYFELYDGQAVTTDDFVHAMELATGKDLTQFKLWYDQAGTPVLEYDINYDSAQQETALTLRQSCPPTPGQPVKRPFHIPVAVGLLSPEGEDMPLKLKGGPQSTASTLTLELTEAEQTFVFESVASRPTLSLLRGFSAPVKVQTSRNLEELIFLLQNDSDEFSRWNSAQKVFTEWIVSRANTFSGEETVEPALAEAFEKVLTNPEIRADLKALLLRPPSFRYLSEFVDELDPYKLKGARDFLIQTLARRFQPKLHDLYNQTSSEGDLHEGSGRRDLKNTLLWYLGHLDAPESQALAQSQLQKSNMTLKLGALSALNLRPGPVREAALYSFYREFEKDSITIDKWLSLTGTYEGPDWQTHFNEAVKSPAFHPEIPNKVYALILGFSANTTGFHNPDGSGYELMADWVLSIDRANPQVASRLVSSFNRWRKLEPQRRELMRAQIERITQAEGVSTNTLEIATKALL